MADSALFKADVQSEGMFFKQGTSPRSFNVRIKEGPLGAIPTVLCEGASMPINGKKEDGIRGIVSYKSRDKGYFSKLKLTCTDQTSGEVIKLCKNALDAWKTAFNPTTKSMWYQKTFGLTDGTKVKFATDAILNPEIYGSYTFEGPESYDAPVNTFFKALYGDEENAPWYTQVDIQNAKEGESAFDIVSTSRLMFRDENGKVLKHKLGSGAPSIPASGLLLTREEDVRAVLMSQWYKDQRWKCRAFIQLRGIDWRTSRDASSGDLVLYPIFKLRTTGSIVFQRTVYELPEGVIPEDQRASLLNNAVLDGMDSGPAPKKRKRSPVVPKKNAVKVSADFEQEIMSNSDIEGDEDDNSKDSE